MRTIRSPAPAGQCIKYNNQAQKTAVEPMNGSFTAEVVNDDLDRLYDNVKKLLNTVKNK